MKLTEIDLVGNKLSMLPKNMNLSKRNLDKGLGMLVNFEPIFFV